MLDTTSTRLAGAVIENTKPTSPAEFYILVIVAGIVLCWGIYWYFRRNADGFKRTGESGAIVLADDRDRLVRIEETLKGFKEEYKQEVSELRSAFHSIVRDRGETMAQIGELKGELRSLIKEIGR